MAARIIIVGAIGFIIGLGFSQMATSGYPHPWEKLPAPPHKVSKLISESGGVGFIETVDGSTYIYSTSPSTWPNEAWIQATPSYGSFSPVEITKPCDFSSSEFSFLSSPPPNIADCVQQKMLYADGYGRYTIVLDRNGDVWKWSYIRTAYEDLSSMVGWPCFGLFIGISIASLVSVFLVKGPSSEKKNAGL